MDIQQYFLNPGELVFSKKEIIIKTVLGSCVAVVMHDLKNKTGGMCHYLLPEADNQAASTKFGNIAVQTLINKFLNSNSSIDSLEASIIGGAFIIFDEKEIFFIGDQNIEVATKILKRNKIRIKSVNTGGEHGKKVVYNTFSNKLLVSGLELEHIDDLYNESK